MWSTNGFEQENKIHFVINMIYSNGMDESKQRMHEYI